MQYPLDSQKLLPANRIVEKTLMTKWIHVSIFLDFLWFLECSTFTLSTADVCVKGIKWVKRCSGLKSRERPQTPVGQSSATPWTIVVKQIPV